MTFEEKFSFEDVNCRRVYFHLEGNFFCMYNQSAYLFLRDVCSRTRDGRPVKVSYGQVKKLGREYFRIGVPAVCLRDFTKSRLVHDVPGMDSRLCYVDLERDLDEGAYVLWCDEQRARGAAAVTPSRMSRLLERQSFRATARDVFRTVLRARANCDARYGCLAGDVYALAKELVLGCVKFFKSADRAAEAVRLCNVCWDLETLVFFLEMEHQVSVKVACDLGEQLDSLRGQLTGLGRKAAQKAAEGAAGKADGADAFVPLEELEPQEEGSGGTRVEN